MHGGNEQRITGPMLFRLLRAAIPQTRSRSICGGDAWPQPLSKAEVTATIEA